MMFYEQEMDILCFANLRAKRAREKSTAGCVWGN